MKKSHNPDQIRKDITQKIADSVRAGVLPWRQPWVVHPNAGHPRNFSTRRRYTGINPVLLQFASTLFEFRSQQWGTAASWLQQVGVHVCKDECCTYVVLFRPIPKKDGDGRPVVRADGKPDTIMLMREYPLFNAEQLVAPALTTLLGVPYPRGILATLLGEPGDAGRKSPVTKEELRKVAAKYAPDAEFRDRTTRAQMAEAIRDAIQRRLDGYLVVDGVANTDPDFAPAEALLAASRARIVHKGDEPRYYPRPTDTIMLPPKRAFQSRRDYYQTAFHELVHWSEAGGRVGKAEDAGYAFCELVAEIGASFVLAEIGVPQSEKVLPQVAQYVDHWLKEMGDDPKYIFRAATQASKCVDFLLTFVGRANPPLPEPEESGEEQHRAA